MTKRAAPWISLALCALLAACGAEGASADASDGNPTATTASTAPVTTTTTVPPPYSFDGSVPPPPLVNTGTDYEAIIRSLDAYTHWLYAHDPDPALVDAVAPLGTTAYERIAGDVAQLSTDNLRVYDTASVLRSAHVVSELPNAVSLRLDYTDDRKVLVDDDGHIVDERTLAPASTFTALLTSDEDGQWRLAAADPAESDRVEP